MKNILLNILGCAIVLCAGISMAAYPVFYSEDEGATYGNVAVPEIPVPAEPAPCAADDQACIDAYLNTFGTQLESSILSQRPPSPVYTWEENVCILNNEDECKINDERWTYFTDRSDYAGLDFQQGPQQEGLVCHEVYDWWGLKYAYKCQEAK